MHRQYDILYIKENNRLNTFLLGYLEKHNYNVTPASGIVLKDAAQKDLVLMGITFPYQEQFEMINILRRGFTKIELPIIILNNSKDPEIIAGFFYYGVNDFLSEYTKPEKILFRIEVQLKLKRAIRKDILFKTTDIDKNLPDEYIDSSGEDDLFFDLKCMRLGITHRQKEITHMVMQGRQNKEIACHLNIACGTVSRHLENIYRKIGVNNRTELAAFFLKP